MRRDGIDAPELGKLIGRSNATILDIGANKGDMSENFANWFPHAQVFAFEPDPRAIAKFLARDSNPRIHLSQMAVGRTIGKAAFYQSAGIDPATAHLVEQTGQAEEWDQSGSVRAPKDHLKEFPWVTFDNKIEISMTTLDRWCSENHIKHIDFIWADVQGAEEDLIMGGTETLKDTKYFYTEFSESELYEGAIGIERIMELLPYFEVLEVFKHDVLLKNTRGWK